MSTTTLQDQLVDLLSDKLAVEGLITPETPFAELELDSLVMLELSVQLEQRYGAHIPEEDLVDAGSIGAVVPLILTQRDSVPIQA